MDRILSINERVKIADKALRCHYREMYKKKRVPNDYVAMFTEGGESDAVSYATAFIQDTKTTKILFEDFAQAQIKAEKLIKEHTREETLKEVLEYAGEPCPHLKIIGKDGRLMHSQPRRTCAVCWAELRAKLKQGVKPE